MIAKLAGLAIDARFAIDGAMEDASAPAARACAARWIAANALAAWGARVALDGTPPSVPSMLVLRAGSLAAALAAIASVPVLLDAAALPCSWRLVLRALGIPVLDRAASAALAAGASVLLPDGSVGCALAVDRESNGFRVRVAPSERTLMA